jgi:hypothetical protein
MYWGWQGKAERCLVSSLAEEENVKWFGPIEDETNILP